MWVFSQQFADFFILKIPEFHRAVLQFLPQRLKVIQHSCRISSDCWFGEALYTWIFAEALIIVRSRRKAALLLPRANIGRDEKERCSCDMMFTVRPYGSVRPHGTDRTKKWSIKRHQTAREGGVCFSFDSEKVFCDFVWFIYIFVEIGCMVRFHVRCNVLF